MKYRPFRENDIVTWRGYKTQGRIIKTIGATVNAKHRVAPEDWRRLPPGMGTVAHYTRALIETPDGRLHLVAVGVLMLVSTVKQEKARAAATP